MQAGFARLDARLDDRRAGFARLDGRLDSIEDRLQALDDRLDTVEEAFGKVDQRLETLERVILPSPADDLSRSPPVALGRIRGRSVNLPRPDSPNKTGHFRGNRLVIGRGLRLEVGSNRLGRSRMHAALRPA